MVDRESGGTVAGKVLGQGRPRTARSPPLGPCTSSSPLTTAQQVHAKKLGLIPLPASEYSPKTDDFAGHAEQNLLAFLARRHQKDSAWRPLQGGASRTVCTDHCAPLIRGSGGRTVGDGEWYFPRERGTHRRLFTWLP
ncbi:hypothetical protein ACGFX4_09505 [Kitasatospora sp. NPDC048365]|uniref:hypothetical protein n=1 Tax=Kitasatospora sp. NPDC048365 TaxID=3364050 RepID=UPI003712C844